VKKPNGQPIGEPFAPLLDRMVKSEVYQDLPPLASKILVYMIHKAPRPYHGENIILGAREAGNHCRCHFTTAATAMRAIHKSSLAVITDKGRRLQGADIDRATRWRLDFWKPKRSNGQDTVAPALHRRVASALHRSRRP
jgi:hypothetical protein